MGLDIAHDIKPVSYVKSHTADMLKYLSERQSPIVITQNGEAKAVMLDVDSYQKMINAMTMLKLIKISEKDITEGKLIDSQSVFSDIREQLIK
jgi:prevent-host-death family protein